MKQPVPVATYLAMIDQLAEEGHIDALTSQERTNFALCYAESGLSQKIIRRIAKQQFAAEDDLLEQPAESRPSVSTSIETLPPENQSGSWPTGCGPTDPPDLGTYQRLIFILEAAFYRPIPIAKRILIINIYLADKQFLFSNTSIC